MNKNVLDFLNGLPVGTKVRIRKSLNHSVEWDTAPDLNEFLLGGDKNREVERYSAVSTADGKEKIVVYLIGWQRDLKFG